MAASKGKVKAPARRNYSREFKQEAVQMVLAGHSARYVAQRLRNQPSSLSRCGGKGGGNRDQSVISCYDGDGRLAVAVRPAMKS